MQVFEPSGRGVGYARLRDGAVVDVPDRPVRAAKSIARRLWVQQQVLVIDDRVTPDPVIAAAQPRDLVEASLAQMRALGVESAMGVPLGAGSECVGFLVLTRSGSDPAWSSVEVDSALQIGHDLGTALLTARALEKERSLVRELKKLDDHRNQMISTLSHELRTPLTVIAGNLELLGQLPLDETGVRFHRAIERGADRMQHVVDDLLLLARVSDPRHPLEVAPVDVRGVITDMLELVETSAAAKEIDLEADLSLDSLVVPGDHAELDRLLANLVSNAVKYTPEGGAVTVTASRTRAEVVLAVTDTGIGISDDDQDGLFRAFFRTTNPDALRESGTGLGLSIVASIVGRHRGTVDVASTLGEGTTFTVTLPAPRRRSR